MSEKKIAYLITNGCPENGLDLAQMREFLKKEGWVFSDKLEESDLILFNACGLTKYTEDESISMINDFKVKKKPEAEFIAYGCLPKINNKRFREVYDGVTFGSDEIEGIQTIIDTTHDPRQVYANYSIKAIHRGCKKGWRIPNLKKLTSFMEIEKYFLLKKYNIFCSAINAIQPYAHIIKVSSGCLSKCSFCAVRISRGLVKSKPIDMLVTEFEEGLAKGFKEVALIGTDLGSYGRDHGNTLVSLLKELVKVKGDYQIRLRNIQPRFLMEMMDDLKPVFDTGKISYLCTAAESGNNRILKQMNRGYTIEEYKNIIQSLNDEYPDILIRTQLIAGFPSETEDEFEDTIQLLDHVKFDIAEAYIFEGREGTKAFDMPNQISQKIKEKRYVRLLKKSANNQPERKKHALELHEKKLRLQRPQLSDKM